MSERTSYIIDMDGVLVQGSTPIAGAAEFIERLKAREIKVLVLTNNPLMMRNALNYLDVHSENAVMIGDRMDTDMIGGIEAGMGTILVLSGVTAREDVGRYAYQPARIVESVAAIEP